VNSGVTVSLCVNRGGSFGITLDIFEVVIFKVPFRAFVKRLCKPESSVVRRKQAPLYASQYGLNDFDCFFGAIAEPSGFEVNNKIKIFCLWFASLYFPLHPNE